jgi:carbonic anhydrase-like protein
MTAPNAISPDAALQRLMQGNERYAANAPDHKDYSAGRAARVSAQFPIAAILSCADSRVSSELAFDQGPGDLFASAASARTPTPCKPRSTAIANNCARWPLAGVVKPERRRVSG